MNKIHGIILGLILSIVSAYMAIDTGIMFFWVIAIVVFAVTGRNFINDEDNEQLESTYGGN